MASLAEPPPRYLHFSAAIDHQLYLWGGNFGREGESELPRTLHIFLSDTEEWRKTETTGVPFISPVRDGACTSEGHLLFYYGGQSAGHDYNGCLYQLNSKLLVRSALSSISDNHAPMPKRGCGIVYQAAVGIVLFGGYGPRPTGPTQPGAQYEYYVGDEVVTNELHIFNLQEGEGYVM